MKELDLNKKKMYENFKVSDLGKNLARLQRICKSLNIPVLFIVDGWESSGRGYVINDLARELNSKYVDVEVFETQNERESKYPFISKYWREIPKKGYVKIFDRSYYYDLFENFKLNEKELDDRIYSIRNFEEMLYKDGTVVVKYFLNVSKEEQSKRIEEYKKSKYKSVYVTKNDLEQNENYEEYREHMKKILEMTNFDFAHWNIIDSNCKKDASKEVLGIALEEVQRGIERVLSRRENGERFNRAYEGVNRPLSDLDMSKSISDEEYDEKLEKLQKDAANILLEYYDRGISSVLVFEGVDAAGKDGAIERLKRYMDPRIVKVYGISAPNEAENERNYLWRFYTKIPKDGDMAIFSRSWYGRVMVERIEGFATKNEWERAYEEMLEMEKILYNHNILIIKFFITIDKEEQFRRFSEREEDPDKQYKITEEDWRNRDKWDEYIDAMNEMLDRTDAEYAPWIIVEGNDKKYARIKVLEEYLKLSKKHLEDMEERKD